MTRPTSARRAARGRPSTRFALLLVLAVATAVALWSLGPPWLARYARQQAAREMDQWALSAAQLWLERAAWLEPEWGDLDLLSAACFRRWGQTDRWRDAVQAAESKMASTAQIELEIALGLIRTGDPHEWIGGAQAELIASGVSPDDIASTFLDHYLTRGDYPAAQQFLEQWAIRHPTPHLDYLWGFYWLQLKDYEQAFDRFQLALQRLPAHELARKMVAELYEIQGRLGPAAEQHLESLRRSPSSTVARLGLARTLRKLNRTAEAGDLLEQLAAEPDPLPQLVQEIGQFELESDNYDRAQQWLLRDPPGETRPDQLLPAAIVAHLVDDRPRAGQLIDRYEAIAARSARSYDLQLRLSLNPTDRQAADQLQQLQTTPVLEPAAAAAGPAGPGAELYSRHCACCHGDSGDGRGPGSRHLFPPARDFRSEPFRLVSSRNAVPAVGDIEKTIEVGMPGTSMPSFAELSENDRHLLADFVLQLHESGVRQQLAARLEEQDERLEAADIAALVQLRTTPAAKVQSPAFGPRDATVIERGKRLYFDLACHQCHGQDGTGAADLDLVDQQRRPTRPRDLVHEPYKGGSDPDSVFLRLYLGMPGTPHPASRAATAAELADLVQFCRSLAAAPPRFLTNYQRRLLACGAGQRSGG